MADIITIYMNTFNLHINPVTAQRQCSLVKVQNDILTSIDQHGIVISMSCYAGSRKSKTMLLKCLVAPKSMITVQCLSQDLETGCLKLAVVKLLGVQIFKGDHNIFIFQP